MIPAESAAATCQGLSVAFFCFLFQWRKSIVIQIQYMPIIPLSRIYGCRLGSLYHRGFPLCQDGSM